MFKLLGNSYISRFLCNLIAFMLLGLLGKYRKNELKRKGVPKRTIVGLRRKWSGEGEVQKSIVLTH